MEPVPGAGGDWWRKPGRFCHPHFVRSTGWYWSRAKVGGERDSGVSLKVVRPAGGTPEKSTPHSPVGFGLSGGWGSGQRGREKA